MLKFFVPLLFTFVVIAQETIKFTKNALIEENPIHKYVSLKDNKVYDIEIIIFAYHHPLPNSKTYSNQAIYDDSAALTLQLKPKDLPFIQAMEAEEHVDSESFEISALNTLDTLDTSENKNH